MNVVASTGSTNADLLEAGKAGAPDGTVLIAEAQTAGRGRRSRNWVSPPGGGLYCSVLLRPDCVPASALGWLPLLAGVALVRATDAACGVRTTVKWPNDLLTVPDEAKCAGSLAELVHAPQLALVLGVGVNVLPLRYAPEPGPGALAATSLAEAGARSTDRTELAATFLTELANLVRGWREAGGDAERSGLAKEYRRNCGTLGRRVRVELTAEKALFGVAEDVAGDGQLVLRGDDGSTEVISAGDVVHLRAVSARE